MTPAEITRAMQELVWAIGHLIDVPADDALRLSGAAHRLSAADTLIPAVTRGGDPALTEFLLVPVEFAGKEPREPTP